MSAGGTFRTIGDLPAHTSIGRQLEAGDIDPAQILVVLSVPRETTVFF